MLQFFRNNSPFTVVLLFIFTLLAKFRVLLHPELPLYIPGHYLYNFILHGSSLLLGKNAFAYTMVSVFVIFTQSLYLKSIATRHKLFPRHNYIPSYVFIMLTSVYPAFSYFSETTIVNWFLMGALDYMFSFTQTSVPRKLIFNASFLLSIAGLFQFTMEAYFLMALAGMVLFRPFNFGEYSVALMGYITPPYFLAGLLFLADRFPLTRQWPHVGFSLSAHVDSPFFLIVTLLGIIIMLVSGVQTMQFNVAMINIYIRRDWIAVGFYLIISTVVAVLTDVEVKSSWLITFPALSIVISHSFLLEKHKKFSSFIFYFSLVYLVLCILMNH